MTRTACLLGSVLAALRVRVLAAEHCRGAFTAGIRDVWRICPWPAAKFVLWFLLGAFVATQSIAGGAFSPSALTGTCWSLGRDELLDWTISSIILRSLWVVARPRASLAG